MITSQAGIAGAAKQKRLPTIRHRLCCELPTKGVLLIGSDFQAVGVCRALAQQNVPTFVLETEIGIARYSRHVQRRAIKHDLLTASDSVDYLLDLAEKQSLAGWMVFCVDDETVEFLAKNHGRLSEVYVLSVPPWEVTRNFYEKDRASDLVRRCGVQVPTVYSSSSLDELLSVEIRYPVVLKPTFKKNYYDKTNKKAVLVGDREALIREFRLMNHLIANDQILVQEFLPGGTRNLFSFAGVFDGEHMVAGLSAHRMRQHPMDFGHATTYAEAREMPDLERQAKAVIKALGYRGVAEVEFMFDEVSQCFKFIEMNGRFWGWHMLAHNAGLNLPFALFQMLQGIEVQRQEPRSGACWTRRLTDVPTVVREVLQGKMSPNSLLRVLSCRTPDAVWSWQDPLPFLMETAMAPYLWWKKGF